MQPRCLALLAACACCAVLLATGCSDRSLVGGRVDDFTAYYNTFYNAQEAFVEGEEQLREQVEREPIDRAAYLPVFMQPPEGSGGGGARASGDTGPFGRAIAKSADILRDHPNSRWVDDALLLIGKAYFYQGNTVGAEQKFREVMDLGGGKEGEARVWYARALVAGSAFEQAAQHVRVSLALDRDFGDWAAMMHLALGDLYVRQEAWARAAEELRAGLDAGPGNDDVAARAAFLLGQVHETRGHYDAAARAYTQAYDAYGPRYELAYAARYDALRMRGLHGDADAALRDLRRMETDDKNFDRRAELTLLRAQILGAQGKAGSARLVLSDLLYEAKQPPSADVRGRAHYTLGLLFRDHLMDFTRAAAHFDTAATALGGLSESDGPRLRAPEAITDSGDLASRFGTLAERTEAVRRLDSLLYLGEMEDEAFAAFVEKLAQRRAEEEERRQRRAERRSENRRFGGGRAPLGSRTARRATATRTPAGGGSGTEAGDAGFLFHRDPARVQENRRLFRQRWGDRPRVENWRRRAAMGSNTGPGRGTPAPADSAARLAGAPPSTTRVAGGAGGTTATAQQGGEAAARALVDLSEVPRTPEAQAAMRAERVAAQYDLANALFLGAARADSAVYWYAQVVNGAEDSLLVQRALYALAEAKQAQGLADEARAVYRQILDQYPETPFAARARLRLGLPADEGTAIASARMADAVATAREQAEADYAAAFVRWEGGDADGALRAMSAVFVRHPDIDSVAPRALLAAGLIRLEQMQRDRLPLDAPLPDTLAHALDALDPQADAARAAEADSAEADSAAAPTDAVRAGTAQAGTAQVGPAQADSAQTPQAAPPPQATPRPTTAGTPASGPADAVGEEASEPATHDEEDAGDEEAEAPPIARVFVVLQARYPDAPQATRAADLLAALDERQRPAPETPPDSVAVDSTTAPQAERPAAPPARRFRVPPTESAPADTSALPSPRADDG